MTTSATAALDPHGHVVHGNAGHGHGGHGDGHDIPYSHPLPISLLVGVFLALIALTGLTVFCSDLPLGEFEMWVSMGIATVKALLVTAYFMHMRYDKPLNILFTAFSLFFVALFIGMCLVDSLAYQPSITARSYDVAKPNP